MPEKHYFFHFTALGQIKQLNRIKKYSNCENSMTLKVVYINMQACQQVWFFIKYYADMSRANDTKPIDTQSFKWKKGINLYM